MTKQQAIQAEIDTLLNQGMVLEVESQPTSEPVLGCYCDCCGKDGRAIVEVYAYREGEKDHDDPMSQLAFIFGRTCIKKMRFTKAKAPKAEVPAESRPNSFDEYITRIEKLLADMEQDAKTYDQVDTYKTALMLLNYNISKKMVK